MKKFSDIIGHEQIKAHLQGAISTGKLSHAYIIAGEDDSGKRTLAEAFARALVCDSGKTDACDCCMSCIQSMTGNHPDIIYVTHEKTRISVDDIRMQVNSDIQIKPFSANHKVYIIDEAEKMNDQAQNALLKTLEEPPSYATIMLLTNNPEAFLQTILSRCVLLNVKPISEDLIIPYLMEHEKIPDYLAKTCAGFSGGNLGKAIKYATSGDFAEMREKVLSLVKGIGDKNQSELSAFIASLGESKDKVNDYLDLISLWYRDILMFKATRDSSGLLFSSELQTISYRAEHTGYLSLNKIFEEIQTTRRRLNANVNFEVTMQLLLLTIQNA